jgi:hypothetical protein
MYNFLKPWFIQKSISKLIFLFSFLSEIQPELLRQPSPPRPFPPVPLASRPHLPPPSSSRHQAATGRRPDASVPPSSTASPSTPSPWSGCHPCKNQLSWEFCKIAPWNFKTSYLFNHNSKSNDSYAYYFIIYYVEVELHDRSKYYANRC